MVGIIPFDQPVPGSPDTPAPAPAPSKRESIAGEGSPGWPPLDTRLHMAQRPRDRQEHPARIRASTLRAASLLQGSGEAHAAAASRAGRAVPSARNPKPNGPGPALGGAPLRRGGGRRPVPGNRRAGTRAVSFQLRAGPGRARPQRGATSGPPREGPSPRR